ncbi:hypothetical protein GN244_ATG14237 [Phytophthora infestans]|uniref:Uncharacterized protein n=1 Tax=Phytophthora infestans TaxID=4787 RepID=A0A833SYA7_PHYIN|nr:hypothetical protein GN244_ATG14237 [Phytophthora infestans]KAF4143978.1 hypothetical protein GN958_ATG06833 [Phytophthora infestans]
MGSRRYPSAIFDGKSPVPNAQASLPVIPKQDKRQASQPSSGLSTRPTPRRQSSQRSMFKSSLVVEQESASDIDALDINPEIIEVLSGEDRTSSPAAPSADEYEEKSSDIIVGIFATRLELSACSASSR